MDASLPTINQILCDIREISYCQPTCPCVRCQQAARRTTTAVRTAIDVNLDHPVLLRSVVSVHYCRTCQHYFRAQPPFLRRDSIYSNQVVSKAVQSVFADGMAMRRATARLARDFWVLPSEGSIRAWCRSYGAAFDFTVDYQQWVVGEFSGVLCIDEVYQDKLALLLAVDPRAPKGDRLVGYQLVHGDVDAADVQGFLVHLRAAGIEPAEVITDGSQLYPAVLRQVWPDAAHQLCLFHESRRLNQAAMKAIHAVLKALPKAPPVPSLFTGGQLRPHPPSPDATDPASQRWYWRQADRRTQIAQVHALATQGLSQRAIAHRTGHNRRTVKLWLEAPVPPLPPEMPETLSGIAALPAPQQRRERKLQLRQQVHTLAQEGLSYSAIARQTGLHRLTVKSWLKHTPEGPDVEPVSSAPQASETLPPPDGWSDWQQVRQLRTDLQKQRFLLLRRPDRLGPEEQQQVAGLLASPVGAELAVIRNFLVDWHAIWHDQNGQRRNLAEAQTLFEAWQQNIASAAIPSLHRIQEQATPESFVKLSQFLRDPHWEQTNNGAERTGRQFRHRQGPHFNMRSEATIAMSINVAAVLHKEASVAPCLPRLHTCQRGRRAKQSAPTALQPNTQAGQVAQS